MKKCTTALFAVLLAVPSASADVTLIDGLGFEWSDIATDTTVDTSAFSSSVPGCFATSTNTWTSTCTTIGGSTTTLLFSSTSEWFTTSTTSCPTFTTTLTLFHETSGASGGVSEGSLNTTTPGITTRDGATTSTTLTDAFDDYNGLNVNGVGYHQNGTAGLEDGGREVVMDPQVIGNLTVQRKMFVPANEGFARWLNIITNNGGAVEQVILRIMSNLGSDEATTIIGTSSGDKLATVDDGCDGEISRLKHSQSELGGRYDAVLDS